MRILSIQSSVAYGHVGNSAAVFPLQCLGHEVWPVLTVHFSNHPGYGHWRGQALDPGVVGEVIDGIDELGVLGTADAVLTGYQGSPGVVDVVLRAVARVRELSPSAVYVCDPVLGDTARGMYVHPELPQLMRTKLLPQADVLTPNLFELAYLAGVDMESLEDTAGILRAVDSLRERGPGTVVVTSVPLSPASGPPMLGMLAVDGTGAYAVGTPRLNLSPHGAGDVTAALFLAHLNAGAEAALARVASSVYAILAETVRHDAGELRLVQSARAIAEPACEFPVRRVR